MGSKATRTCVICHQIQPTQNFPKIARAGHLLEQANICLTCRAQASGDESDEGGGGKQLQHSRNAKQLQYEMELAAALQKELKNQSNLTHNKDIFGLSQRLDDERKKQVAQRELVDSKENINDDLKDDEPNPDLGSDAQMRREKITRLFSVTRSLARNYAVTNNSKATTQKNFSIFSQIKQQQTNTQVKNVEKTNANKMLSKESSTLFHATKESSADEAERLVKAIREGQKIFNK